MHDANDDHHFQTWNVFVIFYLEVCASSVNLRAPDFDGEQVIWAFVEILQVDEKDAKW